MARQNKSYFFEPTTDKSRFLAGDEPTEKTFRDLLDSVPSFEDINSKAGISSFGLVEYATQQDIDLEVGEGVVPSKSLPKTSILNYASNIIPPTLEISKIKEGTKNVFRVALTQLFLKFLEKSTLDYTAGAVGQVLTKTGAETFEWQDQNTGFTPSGTGNQLINGIGGYNEKYSFLGLSGGTVGQTLIKNSSAAGGYTWQDIPNDIPSGGSNGQVLTNGGNNTFSWQSVTSFTYSNVGLGNSIYKETSGTDVRFRGVKKSDSSTFPFEVQLSGSGNDIEIDIDKVNPDDALELNEGDIDWGETGSPTSNGLSGNFNGYIQNLVNQLDSIETVLPTNTSPFSGALATRQQISAISYGSNSTNRRSVYLTGIVNWIPSAGSFTDDILITTLPPELRPQRDQEYYGNVINEDVISTNRCIAIDSVSGEVVLTFPLNFQPKPSNGTEQICFSGVNFVTGFITV